MEITSIILALSTFFCALVAGFLIAFTVVVMPGIQTLNDHDFLQAFKVMDRVIQHNQPIFIFIWLGSVLAVLAAIWIGFTSLAGTDRWLVIIAAAIYIFAAQLPTAIINVPLNNELQQQDLGSQSPAELKESRKRFEPRWIRWNTVRTVVATMSTALFLLVVLKL